jgi:hypothetical protein
MRWFEDVVEVISYKLRVLWDKDKVIGWVI